MGGSSTSSSSAKASPSAGVLLSFSGVVLSAAGAGSPAASAASGAGAALGGCAGTAAGVSSAVCTAGASSGCGASAAAGSAGASTVGAAVAGVSAGALSPASGAGAGSITGVCSAAGSAAGASAATSTGFSAGAAVTASAACSAGASTGCSVFLAGRFRGALGNFSAVSTGFFAVLVRFLAGNLSVGLAASSAGAAAALPAAGADFFARAGFLVRGFGAASADGAEDHSTGMFFSLLICTLPKFSCGKERCKVIPTRDIADHCGPPWQVRGLPICCRCAAQRSGHARCRLCPREPRLRWIARAAPLYFLARTDSF